MASLTDIKSAQIRGSDSAGYRIAVQRSITGNFGQKRVATEVLAERFQRIDGARAFLKSQGVPDEKVSVVAAPGPTSPPD
jgi:hypothetical protein